MVGDGSRIFVEVLIIGAGPAGSVAAALLHRQGRQVLVLEREQFPRFSIGESLLPQSMEYLEQAGMLRAVEEGGFQLKNGAAFGRGEQYTEFDFSDKHSAGWSTTYQVQRARFDHLLALEAERQGAEVHYRYEVVAVDISGQRPRVTVKDLDGKIGLVEAGFLLDASGFGRVLPRLLQLETPSNFPVRGAIFTHIEDNIAPANFDRNKILITVHPVRDDVWYWLIPFADGRCSLGVVGETDFLGEHQGSETERLQSLVQQTPSLHRLLARARWDTPARRIVGYSANVKSLCGPGYALLGNAGEFLDPIFSSGVTIAFKSASLAAAVLERQFAGETVDWRRRIRRAAQARSGYFPRLCRIVVSRRLSADHFPRPSAAGYPAHDFGNSGRICLGPNQSVCARHQAALGGFGGTMRRAVIGTFTALVVLGLAGCGHTPSRSERIGLRLPPAALGASVNLQQHLTVERGGRTDELDAALEIDSERVDLVGLVLGQRVLSLHYDGKTIQSWRHPMLAAELRGEDVLEDLQLTLWPVEQIRLALPAGWRIEENGLRRTLLADDVPVTVIQYSAEPRWSGNIELINLRYHYRLTIRSVLTDS